MVRRYALAIIAAILLAPIQNVFASNFGDTFGFSAKGMSMGNAMTAIVDDWSSVWYNVAGLGRTPGTTGTWMESQESGNLLILAKKKGDLASDDEAAEGEIHANEVAVSYLYSASMHTLSGVSSSKKKEATGELSTGFIIIGLTLDITSAIKLPKRIISSCRFGIGIGTVHDGSLVKVNDINPATPNFVRYGRECEKALILVGLGVGFLNDMLGFGIGLNATFKGKGEVNMTEVKIQPTAQKTLREVKLNLSIDPAAIAGFYFSPGKITKILEGLNIGASYRMESKLEINPFKASALLEVGGVDLPLGLSILDYYTPHIVAGGIGYTIKSIATISFDFEYQLWSKYEFEPTAGLSNLPQLNDIYVIRAGLSIDPLKWFGVSFGYYYQPSIIPEELEEGFANVLDNDKHVGSLGLNFTIPQLKFTGGPIIVNIGYQLQYLVEKNVVKTSAAFDAALNPNYKYGGMVHNVIISLGIRI